MATQPAGSGIRGWVQFWAEHREQFVRAFLPENMTIDGHRKVLREIRYSRDVFLGHIRERYGIELDFTESKPDEPDYVFEDDAETTLYYYVFTLAAAYSIASVSADSILNSGRSDDEQTLTYYSMLAALSTLSCLPVFFLPLRFVPVERTREGGADAVAAWVAQGVSLKRNKRLARLLDRSPGEPFSVLLGDLPAVVCLTTGDEDPFKLIRSLSNEVFEAALHGQLPTSGPSPLRRRVLHGLERELKADLPLERIGERCRRDPEVDLALREMATSELRNLDADEQLATKVRRAGLTPAETRLLAALLYMPARSDRGIAESLGVTPATIAAQHKSLKGKLLAAGLGDLVERADD